MQFTLLKSERPQEVRQLFQVTSAPKCFEEKGWIILIKLQQMHHVRMKTGLSGYAILYLRFFSRTASHISTPAISELLQNSIDLIIACHLQIAAQKKLFTAWLVEACECCTFCIILDDS